MWFSTFVKGGMIGSLVLLAVGCGDGEPAYSTARLAGSVVVDGQPIPNGELQFFPSEGDQAKPVAAMITDGRYECEQVPLGNIRVVFHASRLVGEEAEIFGRRMQATEDLIPVVYRDGISIEVTGDNDATDFNLLTKRSNE